MRFGSLQRSQRVLARSAALVLIGGMAAGCSSGVSRFTDDIFTGSTANQRQIVKKENQPFPGDASRVAPANGVNAPTPARAAVEPQSVTRSSLPPPAASTPVARAETPKVDTTPTGSVTKAAPQTVSTEEEVNQGWSRAGGTQVTLKDGETLYNLSKRFGVPVNEIMKANGIASAETVAVGQKIVIPTYVYSSKAPVSAPDNTRQVADASSSRGLKADVPAKDLPRPTKKPENVAVLPQQPKVKEPEVEAAKSDNSAASASPKAKNSGQGGYTVVAGDSLYGIAKKTGAKAADIRKVNNLGETANLKIGQKLVIPGASQQVAQAAPGVDPMITGSAGPAKKADKPGATKLATYTPPKADSKVIKEAEAASNEAAPDGTGTPDTNVTPHTRHAATARSPRRPMVIVAVAASMPTTKRGSPTATPIPLL